MVEFVHNDMFDMFDNGNKPITKFIGQFFFLSNFSPTHIRYDNKTYPTLEHAYQAAKTLDKTERTKILGCTTPGQAKRMGKTVTLQKDWGKIKLQVMEDLLRKKFADGTTNHSKLLATKERDLIEGNTWNDTFWGVCKGKGENHLGKLLVKIRNEFLYWSW